MYMHMCAHCNLVKNGTPLTPHIRWRIMINNLWKKHAPKKGAVGLTPTADTSPGEPAPKRRRVVNDDSDS